MRVLIAEFQGWGGLWHYAQALCLALRQAGVIPALVTTSGHEPLTVPDLLAFSIGEAESTRGRPGGLVGKARRHATRVMGLAEVIGTFHPQIVHLQGPLGALDSVYFAWIKRKGPRVVYTAHNPRPRRSRQAWLYRLRHAAADAIIVLSEEGRQDLIADGVPASKAFYLPHGNYFQFSSGARHGMREARAALGLPLEGRIALFFGGIMPHKGLDLLIDAFARVRGVDPAAHLVIAGEPREDVSAYRAQIARLGIAQAVTLRLKYVPTADLPLYFLATNVVAFPYRRSYQSGVLNLAYAFARPVVVSETSGLAREVREDGTGLVAPASPNSLADALAELLLDQGKSARLGAQGRRMAATKYAWPPIATRMVEIYRAVSGAAPLPHTGVPQPERASLP